MTNQQHPITPPPELVQQWMRFNNMDIAPFHLAQALANLAARWGADQELEAVCEWLDFQKLAKHERMVSYLRAIRRPKPPSLKEKALAALNEIEDKMLGPTIEENLIRRALEALPE